MKQEIFILELWDVFQKELEEQFYGRKVSAS